MDGGTITGAIVSSGGSEGIAPIIALTAPTVHVAMIAMRMMERSLNQVIDMIAVRDRFMSAVRTMDMTCAFGGGGAVYGVCAADLDDMLVDMIRVDVMQMTIMKVVTMAIVPNGCVSAVRAMVVRMVGMAILDATGHGSLPFTRCRALGFRDSWAPLTDRDGIAGRDRFFERLIELLIDMCGPRRRVGIRLSPFGIVEKRNLGR
jgi:hypothetical protein